MIEDLDELISTCRLLDAVQMDPIIINTVLNDAADRLESLGAQLAEMRAERNEAIKVMSIVTELSLDVLARNNARKAGVSLHEFG
jgi:hypothetical protein